MAHADPPHGAQRWRTSSLGDSTDTSPGELQQLGEHVHQCRGRLAGLRCSLEAVHGFVAARFVTTLALAALALGLLAWMA